MNTIKITLEVSPETARKIIDLVSAEGSAAAASPAHQTPPVQQFSAPVQTAPQTFAPAPIQQFTAPVQTAPAYSIAQLQAACAPLADAGKLPELQQLISTFGVSSLTELPPARYGEFANGLRSLGGVL